MNTPTTTHTPGRWTFSTEEQGRHIIRAEITGRPYVAEATAANAHLIAAAPDLLAALLRLEEGVRLWMSKPIEPADLDAARAAIAKATGGSAK